jgi:type III secretion protein V
MSRVTFRAPGQRRFGSEIGTLAAIVAILALIVVPLPTLLIDMLLGVNITVSVLLLMVALYIPNAVALSSFPSLLLFTTLFRLALNIASTKLILLHADAGHIIEAFGKLVVGGNLVVGIVVFLIIAIVQFIVIAKGSERVAEVGARFTLDAMPGKQMSIDADLRAGHLSGEEARTRRAHLAMESQLHGGMDGAMKFVKGDAIAGLVITAVNLLAGILIGITYHGMPAAEAANVFAVLSIGDAMVSQIPSLLICVAAGVIITRVADDNKKPKPLGLEIVQQMTSNPSALYLAAALLCGFALVPGFPWFVFIGLAAVLVGVARKLQRLGVSDPEASPFKGLQREGAKGEVPWGIEDKPAPFSAPLAVILSIQLGKSLNAELLGAAFEQERGSLQDRLGLPFPGIRVWQQAALSENAYEILVHDVPAGGGVLVMGRLQVLQPSPQLQLRCEAGGPAGGEAQTWWVDSAGLGQAGSAVVLSHEQAVARDAVLVLHDQAHLFLGIQEVQWVLERVGLDYPGLVAEAQKVVPLQRISEVLRRLLEEQVPIRNMRSICESLILWGPKEKDILMLTEYVRGDLGRYLTHHATCGTGALSAVLLDPAVEKVIREAIKPTPAGNYLALPPDTMAAIADDIRTLVEEQPRTCLAVVTSMDIRRYVRRIVEAEMKWLSVYSFQELGPQVKIEPVGRVSL